MTLAKKLARSIAITLTVAGLALGSLSLSSNLQSSVLIADVSGQPGEWDPG